MDRALKSRTSAADAGVDTTMAPAIQATAKALSNKIRRDSLKQNLLSRPEMTELIDHGILRPYADKLATSLHFDASALETALAHRVSKEYLKEIGVLEPYKKHVNSESVDIEKASALLLRALIQRQTPRAQNGVSGQNGNGPNGSNGSQFAFSDVIAPKLQGTAKILEVQRTKDKLSNALKDRPSNPVVMEQQSKAMGYMVDAAPSLQQTIKELGREMIKDTVAQSLRLKLDQNGSNHKITKNGLSGSTPSISSNGSNGVKGRRRGSSTFDAAQLAPALQGIANKLAMEQKKNTLKQQLESRSEAAELVDIGILKPYATSLAARLQLNADVLEQQLAVRVDAGYLKEIGILEPYKKHVDSSPISTDIEGTANLILKSLIAKKRRSSVHGLAPNDSVAASLAATKKQLEMAQTKDQLKQKLANRPSTEVQSKIGVDKSVAPSLQSIKKKLETAQKADVISNTLQHRGSAADHGVDMKISPAVQAMAKQLESNRRRDSLSALVASRPDITELMDSGILQPYSQRLADCLQCDAVQLEQALAHRVSKEYLKEIGVLEPYKKNVDSNSVDIEKASGLLLRALVQRHQRKMDHNEHKKGGAQFGYTDALSPALQETAKSLDIQQKKDKLSSALKERPSNPVVMEQQAKSMGYDINAAPSLQQTIKALEMEMVKDALDRALRERPSAKECGHGVDRKSANKIQSAMHDLEMAQKRDSVSRGMKKRMSVEQVGVDTNLSRPLQGVAKTLEMEIKRDKMQHRLSEVGLVKKQVMENVGQSLGSKSSD